MKKYTSYIPATAAEREKMLHTVGLKNSDELFGSIEDDMKIKDDLKLPDGMTEMEAAMDMQRIAEKNKIFKTIFRGAGAYRHYIPAAVKRITSKEEFVTAYTPYQAELSQGVLQSIFEYQTMICELTGMDVSNASVYDGAAAAAEAVAMCKDRKRSRVLIAGTSNPGVIRTIKTYCHGNGMTCEIIPTKEMRTDMAKLNEILERDGSETACIYIAQPNYYGNLEKAEEISAVAKKAGAKLIMGVNPISLGIVKTPAEYGADIAVGEGQPLGLPLSYGGPYLGFMASTKEMMRKLPGRMVGETTDAERHTAYVLTLQAREQHIRREKASSNICSNEALCAMTAAVYMAVMGAKGIQEAASQSMSKAHYMAEKLTEAGLKVLNTGDWFNEFVTDIQDDNQENTTERETFVQEIMKALEAENMLGGYPLDEENAGRILWCCTEMNTKNEIDEAAEIVRKAIANHKNTANPSCSKTCGNGGSL